ncbi:MAG: restriction endonuclease FokI recognition domain-containing protein [Candidatus Woesebacteria bacterium]|jgi:hypothetical protein
MISIVDYVQSYKHRAAGWVQDAASFDNLHRFVSAFSDKSPYRNELTDKIQQHVEAKLAERFLDIIEQMPISVSYIDIVGSSPGGSRKKNTVCNGIGQAALKGQKREYQGDWPTNNFLRWAESLQFLKYSPSDDTYAITDIGQQYVVASTSDQIDVIRQQLIMYAPAVRVLSLLKDRDECTKFYLGEKIGFIGEKGFTNISEKLFMDVYFSTNSLIDRRKLKSDYEGSSDKYARQICSWLNTVGLVNIVKKKISCNDDELILPAYAISAQGKEFLRKANISKCRFVPFGMLSMEESNKEHICKRRALILKALSGGTNLIEEIVKFEGEQDVEATPSEIEDDILSLRNMGINIIGNNPYQLKDSIDGLYIPRIVSPTTLSKALKIKEQLRRDLRHIDHNLLVLIDFAYGSSKTARLFETYVARVYEQICSDTFLLGGASKPDVVTCMPKMTLIVDSKAYKDGFAMPQGERDKMVRYIEECKQKNSAWYKTIKEKIKTDVVGFQFVSSEFNNAAPKLSEISGRTGVNGSAISAENLLRMVNGALSGEAIDYSKLTSNLEVA